MFSVLVSNAVIIHHFPWFILFQAFRFCLHYVFILLLLLLLIVFVQKASLYRSGGSESKSLNCGKIVDNISHIQSFTGNRQLDIDEAFDIRFSVVFRIAIENTIYVRLITYHRPKSQWVLITEIENSIYSWIPLGKSLTWMYSKRTEAPLHLWMNKYNSHKSVRAFTTHHSYDLVHVWWINIF